MNGEKIVCIIEDKPALRDAMQMMLQLTDGFIPGGSYQSAEEAIPGISAFIPDAVLVDINLPGSSGIECVAALKNRFPQVLFLMCTAYEDDDKIFSSLKAGASGYILKSDGPAKIIDALTEMFKGGSPMSSSIARKVVSSFNRLEAESELIQKLTEREKEILNFLAQGFINKEVADKLNISTATVRTHIQHIYEKLHVNTRVEAVNTFLKR